MCCCDAEYAVGLGILSSPVSSTVDLAVKGHPRSGGGGGGGEFVIATHSNAAAAQSAPSPDMSSPGTLSPSAASLVSRLPLRGANVTALLHLSAESPRGLVGSLAFWCACSLQ